MIDSFDSLKTAVASFIGRVDLTQELDIFIQMVETRLNNNPEFRVREMSVSTTYISKDGIVPFYDNYLTLRSIRNTGGNALTLASPAIMAQSGCSTCPQFYREEGRQLHISPALDYVSLDITYYEKLPALSDINTTNWLLQKAPDVYLYGVLSEYAGFQGEDLRVAGWEMRYLDGINQLIRADLSDRWGGSPRAVNMMSESTSCITDEDGYFPPGERPEPPKFVLLMPDLISDLNILYSYNVTAHFSGDVASYAIYDAPTWLMMDAETGVMSGVPSAEALLTGLTVTATNEYGTVVSNEFDMRVLAEPSGPPRFDESTDQNLFDWHCNVNIPVSFNAFPHFTTGGAVATWSLNNAPSWLSIDSTTGVLRGTPLATEAATDVSITATNSKGSDTSNPFNVQTLNAVMPHRYWREVYFRNTTDETYYGQTYVTQMEMMESHGGSTVCVGGACFLDSPTNTAILCARIFGGFPGSSDSDSVAGLYPDCANIGYDFGDGNDKAIVEVMGAIGNSSVTLARMPKEHAFQYSDDGVTYVSIFNTVDDTGWTINQRRYHDLIEEV